MRCLNCNREDLPADAQTCPGCGVYLPSLTAHVLAPGTTLRHGAYRLGRVLGWGGFGITYLARHLSLDQPVAIKEFYPREHAQRNAMSGEVHVRPLRRDAYEEAVREYGRALERFGREGRVLARLEHPNVVRVRDHFEERGTAYLVMDYVASGHTLDDELRARPRRRLPEPRARDITAQLVSALEAVHAQGVYHLDVKPENVLLTEDGRAVLIDFGASRHGLGAKTTHAAYTPEYAPPEIEDRELVGPWSDVYELGVTAYEMLAGERPPRAIARLLSREEWAPDKAPAQWRGPLAEALRLRREERPQSVGAWWRLVQESRTAPVRAAPRPATPPPAVDPRYARETLRPPAQKRPAVAAAKPPPPVDAKYAREHVSAAAPAPKSPPAASAQVEKVWLEHEAEEHGHRGVRVHVKFQVSGMHGARCNVAAFFYTSPDVPLKDKNYESGWAGGHVETDRTFTPTYKVETYNDFTLFMPYYQLRAATKRRALLAGVELLARPGDRSSLLAKSELLPLNIAGRAAVPTDLLVGLTGAGALLTPLVAAAVLAVGAPFAGVWGDAISIVWRGALVWLVWGGLTGAVVSLLGRFAKKFETAILLGLVAGASLAAGLAYYGRSLGPDFFAEWYAGSFGRVSHFINVPIGGLLGAFVGAVVGTTAESAAGEG